MTLKVFQMLGNCRNTSPAEFLSHIAKLYFLDVVSLTPTFYEVPYEYDVRATGWFY